ncbi:uncharacterized protein [Henckelia pumila]|uniref:uncharacterized protein isoform X2 n=1 Tax=Henckelia pumila TaxID=405737 RepID=UPI003C6E6DB3
MEYARFSDSELRELCDEYNDPKDMLCGGWKTLFYVDDVADIRDKAETTLKFYNKKQRTNFVLDKIVKVNFQSFVYYCMTFWAKRTENDERRLFRGVYYRQRGVYGRGNVLLCEIKGGDDEITIPAGHDDGEAMTFEIADSLLECDGGCDCAA